MHGILIIDSLLVCWVYILKHTALCMLVIENKLCLHRAAAGSHTVGNLSHGV